MLTEESIRYSSPKADVIVRDSLAAALRQRLDEDFIDPAKTAVAGVSPASITNGAETIASAGDDADDVRIDIRSVVGQVYRREQSAVERRVDHVLEQRGGVGDDDQSARTAGVRSDGHDRRHAARHAGDRQSDYVGDIVVLVNASDIYLADEGEISVDASREASLEMSDAPAHTSGVPTPATLVSDVADKQRRHSSRAHHQLDAAPRSRRRVSDWRVLGRPG